MATDDTQWVVDPALIQYARTARQVEILEAVNTHGGHTAAAKALGIARQNVDTIVKLVKSQASTKGFEQDPRRVKTVVAGPYVVRGKSTYFNKDGNPTQEWVKTRLDQEAYLRAVQEATRAFVEDVIPIPAVSAEPLNYDTDIIPWLQIGDAHLGMLAHANEVGENFDLKIAERELCAAFTILIGELPPCARLVINDLGDFTHYENTEAVTEASGHCLDFDTRFPRMIKAYSRIMRFLITLALTKAQTVDVIINQGNHSRTNDTWMAELLRVAYGTNNRVNVLDNDSVFIAYRMGATLVMVHHSDKCRPAHLAQVMTVDFAKDWGETEYHYIDIGHIHHAMVLKEHPGVLIESFNQLAANDKWAHDGGYRSRASITVVYRSRTYGEVGRRLLPIRQIRDRIARSPEGAGVVFPSPKVAFSV